VAKSEPVPAAAATGGRLPPGRHKLGREFVVRSQRDRMLDAMAQVCAAEGYGRASVPVVARLAGVSRKTFYEQFADREDCFLAAYDAILAQFLERVIAAYGQTELEWPDRLRAAIEALLAFLASEPAFARMCLVEVLAAGPRALERYVGAVGGLAELLAEGRGRVRAAEEPPEDIATDVIEGGAFLIREQILAGRTEELRTLLPDILYATLVPYLGPEEALRHTQPRRSRTSAKARRAAEGTPSGATETQPSRAPEQPAPARERQERWREEAKRARYERMLEAMIDTVAERGYHQTSLSDVAARAGVSRDTLRQQFGDRQGLFIAAHDWLLERLASYVAPAYQQPGAWSQRVSSALDAMLTAIAYRPQGARVAIIEVLAAGREAHQHHLAAIDTFTAYIDQGRKETRNGPNLPPALARIVAGAVAARIHKHVATGRTSELPQLHPELLYIVLLPYIGHREARQHLPMTRPSERAR
jgi:AcrR family transcriptional regulator